MRFTERASFTGGESDFVVPAEIRRQMTGANTVDDSHVSAGGRVEFYVRKGAATAKLLTEPSRRVEFQRFQPGVYYSVNSVELQEGARLILVACQRD